MREVGLSSYFIVITVLYIHFIRQLNLYIAYVTMWLLIMHYTSILANNHL